MTSILEDRIGPFTAVPNQFINDPTISHEAFRLFVLLRQFTNTERGDDVAFPSYDTIKERTGILGFATIAKKLRELESKGWIQRKKRYGASTLYTLMSPSLAVGLRSDEGLRQVNASPSGDEGQSFTPAKTNKKNLTRRTEQEEKAASAARKKSPPKEKTPRTPDAFFDYLAELTASLPAVQGGYIARTKKVLAEGGATIEDLRAFANWWEAVYWPEKKKGPPTLDQITKLWGHFKKWQTGATAKQAAVENIEDMMTLPNGKVVKYAD